MPQGMSRRQSTSKKGRPCPPTVLPPPAASQPVYVRRHCRAECPPGQDELDHDWELVSTGRCNSAGECAPCTVQIAPPYRMCCPPAPPEPDPCQNAKWVLESEEMHGGRKTKKTCWYKRRNPPKVNVPKKKYGPIDKELPCPPCL